MTNNYITLSNSTHSLSVKYRAIQYSPLMLRGDTVEYTLGGKIDKQNGPVVEQIKYTLRIPVDTPPTGYGTYANFKTLFALANSNLSPSDVIVLTDHFATAYNTYFVGDVAPEPLTTVLEGANAWFLVPVTFHIIGLHT